MQILTLCGSLRSRSSNRAILRACEQLALPGMSFEHYESIASLPHYNPELDCDPLPDEVVTLRRHVAHADALILATPEYVHGLPGAFKNALDWLVSDPAFAEKPVVILHTSLGAQWALASLREVLKTMSARIIEEASILLPISSNRVDENELLLQEDIRLLLSTSLQALAKAVKPFPT